MCCIAFASYLAGGLTSQRLAYPSCPVLHRHPGVYRFDSAQNVGWRRRILRYPGVFPGKTGFNLHIAQRVRQSAQFGSSFVVPEFAPE
jgi:hypothetical protein